MPLPICIRFPIDASGNSLVHSLSSLDLQLCISDDVLFEIVIESEGARVHLDLPHAPIQRHFSSRNRLGDSPPGPSNPPIPPFNAISRLGTSSELPATRHGLPVCERFPQWASLCSSGAAARAARLAAAFGPPAAGAPVLAFLDYELQLQLGISDDMYNVEAAVLTLNYWKRRLNPKVLAPI